MTATKMPDNAMILPSWFVKVAGGVCALAIPWAGWVTMTLKEVSLKIDMATKSEVKVDQLRAEFSEHVANPNIHEAGFSKVDVRMNDFERRISLLERKAQP